MIDYVVYYTVNGVQYQTVLTASGWPDLAAKIDALGVNLYSSVQVYPR